MRRLVPLLAVVVLLLSAQPVPWAAASPEAPASSDQGSAPWWTSWGGDADRDGVHDLLERRVDALASDPTARLAIVVDFPREVRGEDVARLEALGLEVQFVSRHVDAVLGSAPAAAVRAIRAVPDAVMLEAQGVGVPLLQSAMTSVGLNVAHADLGFTGRGVTVAVLDTGVRASHISLDDLDDKPATNDPKLVVFYDAFTNQTGLPFDGGQHGTWTAGIAVGTGGGTRNVGGGPSARLVAVRIGTEGGFPEDTALRGMEWVIDNKELYNISVMSCSWGILLGGPNDHNGNSAISRMADEVVRAGISVVVAGGNTALSATVTAPGDADLVVTVGSVSDSHVLSSFSSEGPTADGRIKPDVCAPGESITAPSSADDASWYTGDGTSASAPLVAGLIACMLEANPKLTPANVKQILHETSEHNTALSPKYVFTPNNGYGWGVVDAQSAVMRARDLRAPKLELPADIGASDSIEVKLRGSYTRTQNTDRGDDGRSPLGDDTVELEATVPGDWDRPTGASYTMEDGLRATVVPDPVSQDGDSWLLHATYVVRQDVSQPTTATPTITFTTATPLSAEGKVYNLTGRMRLNDMDGQWRNITIAVGGNVPPTIEVLTPAAAGQVADEVLEVRWTDSDPDSDAAISLWSDTDTDPSSGLVVIADELTEDPEGTGDSYIWDTTTLLEGSTYYVRAVIDDGVNPPVPSYSPGAVTVRHTGGVAPTVEVFEPDGTGDVADALFVIQWSARDPDSIATVDLYWDIDAAGFDGAVIARGLQEYDGPSQYTWDTSALPDGAARWVYAIASDGNHAPAKAYSRGPVTVVHGGGPEVVSTAPTGVGVDLDEPVRVAFDTSMDTGSVERALTVSPSRPGITTWVGYTLRYDPSGGWAPSTRYTVTVAGAAKDSEGDALGQDVSWQFSTVASQPPPQTRRVSILSPREADTVSGEVWVEGVSDGLPVGSTVEVRIDDGGWRTASGNDRWLLQWDTALEDDGAHALFARGVDPDGLATTVAMVNVTVRNQANRAPVVQPIPDFTVYAGEEVRVQVVAVDPDGDALTYTDSTPLFELDPATGSASTRPGEGQAGTWPVTVTVSDGSAKAYVTFNVTVRSRGDGGGSPLPSWLSPSQALLLVVAVAVGILLLYVSRQGRSRRTGRTSAHKVKIPVKDNTKRGVTR